MTELEKPKPTVVWTGNSTSCTISINVSTVSKFEVKATNGETLNVPPSSGTYYFSNIPDRLNVTVSGNSVTFSVKFFTGNYGISSVTAYVMP